ncbi:MAG TPA: hypothetical protein VK846_17110 [Candidatus Limnocylindria bacterium]|nr:hypothetical protein [Candidatus Limnocylindria bacterium]
MNKQLNAAGRQRAAALPKTLWGFLSIAAVCVTAAFLATHFMPAKKGPPPRRLWTPLVVNNLNTEMVVPDTLRLEFWTPSVKTKDYLAADKGDTNRNWEAIESDDVVLQFGKYLRTDPDVVGYRRSEVWGHGRTALKPGWWWSITVRTNYPVSKLAKSYREFWKTQSSLFVEVIDNRGHDAE